MYTYIMVASPWMLRPNQNPRYRFVIVLWDEWGGEGIEVNGPNVQCGVEMKCPFDNITEHSETKWGRSHHPSPISLSLMFAPYL